MARRTAARSRAAGGGASSRPRTPTRCAAASARRTAARRSRCRRAASAGVGPTTCVPSGRCAAAAGAAVGADRRAGIAHAVVDLRRETGRHRDGRETLLAEQAPRVAAAVHGRLAGRAELRRRQVARRIGERVEPARCMHCSTICCTAKRRSMRSRHVELLRLLLPLARALAVGKLRVVVEVRLRDEIGVAADLRVAALREIAVHHVAALARRLRLAEIAQRQRARARASDPRPWRRASRCDRVVGLPAASTGNSSGNCRVNSCVVELRVVAARCSRRTARRPAPGSTIVAPSVCEVADGAIDDVDRLGVHLREQALVHVLAHDADRARRRAASGARSVS